MNVTQMITVLQTGLPIQLAYLLSSQQMVGNDTSTLHLQIRSIRHIYIYHSIHNYILFHDHTLKASQTILLSVWSVPIKKE